ncbi:MAG: hypothetical protein LH645_00980 [Actinomycetia bacterium]|nr:hypothetical protein [Actinomycetes bacterium]
MLQDKGAVLVGGVCRSEEKDGKDLGELAGIGAIGAHVTRDAASLLDTTNPDVVVMTIASYMTDVKEPILLCLRRGINVISVAEELAYSWHTSPVDTAEIDECARPMGFRSSLAAIRTPTGSRSFPHSWVWCTGRNV